MPKIFDRYRRQLFTAAALALPGFGLTRSYAATPVSQAIIQPGIPADSAFIERALQMRQLAIDSGDQAYGACVVRDGVIVGQAPSHVLSHGDPTAHAEMEAIRDAATRLGRRDLSDCRLYSSSRACPMCEAAAYWSNITGMIYGEQASDGGRPRLC